MVGLIAFEILPSFDGESLYEQFTITLCSIFEVKGLMQFSGYG